MRKFGPPLLAGMLLAGFVAAQDLPLKGWTQGKGFGAVYGKEDQVGALNAITDPAHVLRAMQDVKAGRVYDMGIRIDRTSYKWPGHSPTEILSFRRTDGLRRANDIPAFSQSAKKLGFNSCALFISDNIGTQIDGLAHFTRGEDSAWYNGFRAKEHATDFGVTRADADSIPPVIGRALMLDVAGWKKVDALPANFPIGPKELQAAMSAQGVEIQPGDIVFIRTGTLRYWGETGADHAAIARHDSAGLTLEGARWLVEQKGAVMIGADTSGVEVANPDNPVHEYLLIDQGVHLAEFHYLEDLARDKVYRFTYFAATNRLKGTVAGTAMRPVAIR